MSVALYVPPRDIIHTVQDPVQALADLESLYHCFHGSPPPPPPSPLACPLDTTPDTPKGGVGGDASFASVLRPVWGSVLPTRIRLKGPHGMCNGSPTPNWDGGAVAGAPVWAVY